MLFQMLRGQRRGAGRGGAGWGDRIVGRLLPGESKAQQVRAGGVAAPSAAPRQIYWGPMSLEARCFQGKKPRADPGPMSSWSQP